MHTQPRPNLMSSAPRGGHEDSILARLEREPARGAGAGTGARLAWYGTAALVALGLTGMLAWLAAGTGPAVLEMAHPAQPPRAARAAPAPAPLPPPVPPLRLIVPPVERPVVVPARVAVALPGVATLHRPQAVRAPARQAARPARSANPARAGEAPEDSDVAVISAVIYHANGHAAADGDAQAACADAPCHSRPGR